MRSFSTLFIDFALVVVFLGAQMVQAHYSRFLDAFLRNAMLRSELDVNFHVPGMGSFVIKETSCFGFEATDITFHRKDPQIDMNETIGVSLARNLGMTCQMNAVLNEQRAVNITVDVRNGEWSSAIKYSFLNNFVRNVTLVDCTAAFFFTKQSFKVEGLGKLTTAVIDAIYAQFAGIIGPYVIDPVMCSSLAFFVETINVSLHLAYKAKNAVKVPRHTWPDIRLLERLVKPFSANSSLFMAPYTESTLIELASAMVNDLLGAKPKTPRKGVRDIVMNRVVREKVSSDHTGTILVQTCCNEQGRGVKLGEVDLMDVPISLLLTKFSLTNMDTFRTFDVLHAISKLTLNHTVVLDGPIDFVMGFQILLSPTHDDETIISFEIRGAIGGPVQFNAYTLLAFDQHRLIDGTNIENLISCLLSALAAVQIPRISLAYDIESSRFPQLAALDDDTFANIVQSFLDVYLRPIIDGVTQEHIDEWMHILAWYGSPLATSYIREYHNCPAISKHDFPPPVPTQGFVQMDKPPVTFLDFFINRFLGPDDPDFSLSRVMEIVASVLSSPVDAPRKDSSLEPPNESSLQQQQSRRPQDGYLKRDDTIKLGPINLLKPFPTLKDETAGVDPSLTFYLGNLTLGPLNDFNWISLFTSNESLGPYYLNNQLVMNSNAKLKVKFDIAIALVGLLDGPRRDMTPRFTIEAEFASVSVLAGLVTRFNLEALTHLNLKQIVSSCIGYIFPAEGTFKLDDVLMDMRDFSFKMKCNQHHESGRTNAYSTTKSSSCDLGFTQRFVDHISSPESNQALLEFLKGSIPRVSAVLSGRDKSLFDGFDVPKGTDHLLGDLQRMCAGIPHPSKPKVEKPTWIPPMQSVMLLAALGMVLHFLGYMWMVHRSHRTIRKKQSHRLINSPLLSVVEGSAQLQPRPVLRESLLSNPSPNVSEQQDAEGILEEYDVVEDIILGSSLEDMERLHRSPLAQMIRAPSISPGHIRALLFGLAATEDDSGQNMQDALYLLGLSKPLAKHPGIRVSVRVTITVLLLVNFVIFVAGVSFFTMGVISVYGRLGEETLKEIPMMVLTLDTCIDMMVEGRAILFAIFIGVSSGIFPWIRVAMLAFIWLAPPTILPVERRGRMVETLESIGKWSLAEVYLFAIMTTMISVQMTNPSKWSFILPHTFNADVECVPKWGLFGFLIATWVSLFLNHAIVHLHRQAVHKDLRSLPSPPMPKDYEFMPLRLDKSGNKYWISVIVPVLLVVWPISLVCALSLDTLKIQFLGFSGFGVNLMTDHSSSTAVSLSQIFHLLVYSDPADAENKFGLLLLCFGYFLFILVAPACLCALSVIVWVVPLQKRHQVPLLNTLRVLYAWSTVDVLACTLLVVILQLHKFFQAMSGLITFLPSWMGPVLHEFGASDDEAAGFGVKAELDMIGFGWIVVLCVIGNVCSKVVYVALQNAKTTLPLPIATT